MARKDCRTTIIYLSFPLLPHRANGAVRKKGNSAADVTTLKHRVGTGAGAVGVMDRLTQQAPTGVTP